MSYGLEVYDAQGNRVFGVDDRAARFVVAFTWQFYAAQTQIYSETFTVPGLRNNGEWMVFSSNFRTWVSIPQNDTLECFADVYADSGYGVDVTSLISIMRV